MSTLLPRPNTPISPQPAHDATPRRLIVAANVIAFAVRDWSLWVLLRDGPWGPPMRLVLGAETVTDAVESTLSTLLLWPSRASLLQLKASWQEQEVYVWGSSEQGSAISLSHSILLRANRDELRPNLHLQPIPSLRVKWIPVADIESGQQPLDPDVLPSLKTALHTLRSQVQSDIEVVLRYLADMSMMKTTKSDSDQWRQGMNVLGSKETRPLGSLKEPSVGDGVMTLIEVALLYRAFFPPEEQIDLSNLQQRLLATNKLQPLNEDRPVRGREMDRHRVSRAYRYLG